MLDAEFALYRRELPRLLGPGDCNAGRWCVIKGDGYAAPFGTYEDALRYGYAAYGPAPFLAKRIEREEPVLWFSRPV